ncbi:sulfite exporter TauE/SafE family protein [Robertkochia sediminum]|uniref:sulfite exporter TauE/SafE family protein n=1 Tax=Robertkochia sediminum TaxID=2785326 RepID=UPI0019321910|nr:sulfite exporter TauE/SafE family protein [Robertkochia sediminum]MBL7473325.1 sulfite exporter TauE/SafE family protein [Robertkochia sediminum]
MSPILEILILVVVGFIVGVINTISGGGSMLTLPILIFFLGDSAMANGTNRVAIFLQTISSIAGFRSKGLTIPKPSWWLGVAATIGAFIGSLIAVDISNTVFNRILAIFMIVIVAFMVLKPTKNLNDLAERFTGKYFWGSLIAFFFIGIYGGFLQAGTGIFMLLALSSINQMTLVRSNLVKAVVMLIYTAVSLSVFFYHDKVNLKYGLLLASGQFVGGWVSSRWSVAKGDGLVKTFLIIMVIAMAVKLWLF